MPPPVLAVVSFLTAVVLMIVVGATLQGMHSQYGLIASELVCILLPALITAGLMRGEPNLPNAQKLGRPSGLSVVLWIIVTSALLGFAANALTGILAEVSPPLKEIATAYEAMFQGLMFPDEPLHRYAAIAAICVFAPVCEEVLFRGVILPLQLASKRPIAVVILLNGLMFSLVHMNPLSFVALILVGAFFAHVSILTKSLWACILAHATLNFANGVLGPILAETSTSVSEPVLADYAMAAAVLTPIVAGLWYLGVRQLFKSGRTDA